MLDDYLGQLLEWARSQLGQARGTTRGTALEQLIDELERLRSLRVRPDEGRDEQYFSAFRLLILMGEAGFYE